MSEIDDLLKVVAEVNMPNLKNEISNLRDVRDWALTQIGVDYTEGDEVTIISERPYLTGGGWEAHKETLKIGKKGIVKEIFFNSPARQWTAMVDFPHPKQKPGTAERRIQFLFNAGWVAKDPAAHGSASDEMTMLAQELDTAEEKLVYLDECCSVIENNGEPMVPLQQVRNMLEGPHRAIRQRLHETAKEGVNTPGCDCGKNGLGRAWHGTDCRWRKASGRSSKVRDLFRTAVSKALSEWNSDVPESKDMAKNDYLAMRMAEIHEGLVRNMSHAD